MTNEEYRIQVDARARQMLDAIAPEANSLWSAHALMGQKESGEQVAKLMETQLGKPIIGPFDRVASGTFALLGAMFLVCRWKEELPEEAIERVRQLMTRGILHRGNTENHWLMNYTGNLLAAEFWEEEEIWWNGQSREAAYAEAKRWILGMIERTAINGHHEYDSPQYHLCHVLSMIALADHARDEQVQQQAEQVLSLMIADMALEYFKGAWAGGHSREGYRQNTWTRTGDIKGLHFLYFGGEEFDPDLHLSGMIGPALTARYRPPALFAEMAWDRRTPHVVKKTRAPRTIYRHVERESQPVRKYTYMSSSFALGSTQVGLPGAQAGPIDLVSWDLTWDGPDHQAKIVCNHPYRSPGRFSAFLSELPQVIGRNVPTDKPYLQFFDRLFGASPYEQLMQHEGTLIALYRIPKEDETPYVNLYLPKGIAWEEREGWILGDAGEFYTALSPIGRYSWTSIREENLIDGWLVRIEERQAGLVLEAAEAKDAGGFDAFCKTRTNQPVDLNGWPERVAVQATGGQRLEMIYDGVHRVDGKAIDYDAYPLYGAPGVEAESGSGKMAFRRGADEVQLDFKVEPGKALLPMRVIG